MRPWNDLITRILTLQNESVCFHPEMQTAFVEIWQAHNTRVLSDMLAMLALPLTDEAKEDRLVLYLSIRWQLIQKTSVDYTFYPNFPANKACLWVAEALANQRGIIELLMPSVKSIIGPCAEGMSLKELTEDSGQFEPANFLLNAKADELIDIETVFGALRTDPDREQRLTTEDYKRLSSLSSDATQYLEGLKIIHAAKNSQKPSFARLFREIQKGLLASSRKNSGSETQADFSEAKEPILKLFHYWTLLKNDEKRADDYRTIRDFIFYTSFDITTKQHLNYSCESMVLALFSTVPDVTLSEKELRISVIINNNIVFRCTEQLSNTLDAFLKHYVELENIALPTHEAEFLHGVALPTGAYLDFCYHKVFKAILERKPLLAEDGVIDIKKNIFDDFSAKMCLINFSYTDFFSENSVVDRSLNTYCDIPSVLTMLPLFTWGVFFSSYACRINNLFYQNIDALTILFHWVESISVNYWPTFFAEIYKNSFLNEFIIDGFAEIFSHIPEKNYPNLFSAVQPYIRKIFKSKDGVITFLKSLATTIHVYEIGSLFLEEIKNVFNAEFLLDETLPEKIVVDIFRSIENTYYDVFMMLLKDVLMKKITTRCQLTFILGRFEYFGIRVIFLQHFFTHFPEFPVDNFLLISLLAMTKKRDWNDLVKVIPRDSIMRIIMGHENVVSLLSQFNDSDDRKMCARAIQSSVFLNDPISAKSFVEMLKKFPESEDSILMMYRHQMPRIIMTLLSYCDIADSFQTTPVSEITESLSFLLDKTSPYFLNGGYLFSLSRNGLESPEIMTLKTDFDAISKRYFSKIFVFYYQLKLLDTFLEKHPGVLKLPSSGMSHDFFKLLLKHWDVIYPAAARVQPSPGILFSATHRLFPPCSNITRSGEVLPMPALRARSSFVAQENGQNIDVTEMRRYQTR